jgi:PKD repeat protein
LYLDASPTQKSAPVKHDGDSSDPKPFTIIEALVSSTKTNDATLTPTTEATSAPKTEVTKSSAVPEATTTEQDDDYEELPVLDTDDREK